MTLEAYLSEPGKQLIAPVTVYNGHTTILAYATTIDLLNFDVYARKVTPSGALDGPRYLVDHYTGSPGLRVASNGDDFLFCWSSDATHETTCDAWRDGQTTAHSSPQQGVGAAIWSAAGYVLDLGIALDENFNLQKRVVQQVDASATPLGSPLVLEASVPEAWLVATASGFVFNDNNRVIRLDASFHQTGNTVDILNGNVNQLIRSGDHTAIVTMSDMSFKISVLGPDDTLTPPQVLPEGWVAGAKASFALAYVQSATNQTVYVPIAIDGTPGGRVPLFASTQPSVRFKPAITEVQDGFLVVSNVTADGSDIQVAHLACP